MNMLLYVSMSLFVTVYFYLLISGLRLHKKLEQLQKNIDINRKQSAAHRLENAYINTLHCSLAGIKKTCQDNISTGSGCPPTLHAPMSTKHPKNELIDFLHDLIKQYNDSFEANIKLVVVRGSCPVAYRDSLAVLRLIIQLAEKAKENKIGSTSVFMLLIAPLQIAIEITKPASYDACVLRSIIEPETLRSSSLHIIHHEADNTYERFVVAVVEDDEDNSSRRPRDFQRKH